MAVAPMKGPSNPELLVRSSSETTFLPSAMSELSSNLTLELHLGESVERVQLARCALEVLFSAFAVKLDLTALGSTLSHALVGLDAEALSFLHQRVDIGLLRVRLVVENSHMVGQCILNQKRLARLIVGKRPPMKQQRNVSVVMGLEISDRVLLQDCVPNLRTNVSPRP